MSDDKKNIDLQTDDNKKKDKDKKADKKDKLKKLNKRCQELENKYKRALADYQNLLKRTAIEKQEFAKYANEQLLLEILPVFDNLKMSLKHADEAADKNGWLEGVKHVIKQFRNILETMGVEEIRTKGEKFDPATMEALEVHPSTGSGQGGERVVKEVKAGYRLNGKVIVPAKVILE